MQVLNHPWLTESTKNENQALNGALLNYGKLAGFMKADKLNKVFLKTIASQLQDTDIEDLKNLFLALDENNDGQLSIQEVEEGKIDLG